MNPIGWCDLTMNPITGCRLKCPSGLLFLVGLVALWVSGMLIGAENLGEVMP